MNFSRQTLPTRKISSVDKRKIVIFLVDHISKKEVLQKLHEDSFYFEFEYLESENEFIESVRVSSYPGKNTLTVSENKSYLTGVIPQKYLELIINEKESKMDFSRNMETWLLIVVAEEDYSCGIIDPSMLNYKFDNPLFKRIFILERASKRLFELKV